MNNNQNLLLISTCCSFFFYSCKKNPEPEIPPTQSQKDSLKIIKSNFTGVDTLQDIYKGNNGGVYYLYGKRRSDGKITKVSSMAKKNKTHQILY